jgi:hypothetical protein
MYNRRELRSTSPLKALSLFLAERRVRLGAEALVVATDDGLMVSGVGAGDLELLAAASALESTGSNGRQHLASDMKLNHASILIGDSRIVIATLGAAHSESVSAGVSRILAAA